MSCPARSIRSVWGLKAQIAPLGATPARAEVSPPATYTVPLMVTALAPVSGSDNDPTNRAEWVAGSISWMAEVG